MTNDSHRVRIDQAIIGFLKQYGQELCIGNVRKRTDRAREIAPSIRVARPMCDVSRNFCIAASNQAACQPWQRLDCYETTRGGKRAHLQHGCANVV
jgi:hypothetical protein